MIKYKVCLVFLVLFLSWTLEAKEFHVSIKKGKDSNEGSISKPFKTISEAIKQAAVEWAYNTTGAYADIKIQSNTGM